MEPIFPMQTYNAKDDETIVFCNKVMEFLKERLPMNFRKWFIIREYDNPTASTTTSYPATGIEPYLRLRDDSFIIINLFCFDRTLIPVPNPNMSYDSYDLSDVKPNIMEFEDVKRLVPYMFDKDGDIPLDIIYTRRLYLCIHEWMHTLTYVDWNLGDKDVDYMWFIEYQVDIKVLNFVRTYYYDIIRELRFRPHMQYLEDLVKGMNHHIIQKLPKFICN